MGWVLGKDEREGEKDTDERRESSGRAPRLGASAKDYEGLGPLAATWRASAGTFALACSVYI